MAQAALTIDGLGVDFSGFKAVSNVSTIVEDGELRVLLGANGAGKTTLMDLGVRAQDQEHRGAGVPARHRDITNWEEHKIARAGLGRKFQIPSVFKELSVRRNLEVRQLPQSRRAARICASAFGKQAAIQDVDHVLELIGLHRRGQHETRRVSQPRSGPSAGWNSVC